MNRKKISIALLVPSLQSGGMERVMSELANYFSTLRFVDVHLVLFGKKPELFYSIHNSVSVHKAPFGFNDRLRVIEFLKRLYYIRSKIKNIDPDVALSFGTQWNNMTLLALQGTKIPVFVSDRGSPERIYKKTQEVLRSILYPKTAGIIAQTDTAKKLLKKRFPSSDIETIGNPIRQISTNQYSKRENIILSVGRLIETKHHDRLIEIFSKLDAPDWKLLIAGANALNENNFNILEDKIESLGLQDRVELLGRVQNVDAIYSKSKIFAFTSSVEGFPNVVGEALSAGCPVVSYDCIAGPSEMIENGINGFLVEVFDDSTFQNSLQELINDEKLAERMSKNAINSIDKFSVKKIGEKYLKFLISKINNT